MWTLAASLSSQFQLIRNSLYSEARQLLDALESSDNSTSPEMCGRTFHGRLRAASTSSRFKPGFSSSLRATPEPYQRGIMSAGTTFRLVNMMRVTESIVIATLYEPILEQQ
ncbi:fungal-specific transcription factor domain protein [Apiospora sp. TS-2023a]